MTFEIRSARAEDVNHIVGWTSDTFSWGDYVPDRLAKWLADNSSTVLVATVRDNPVALVHAVMLSPSEGWLEAARVHPDHRRTGLGNALNSAGVRWAVERGARVVRLAAETANLPAATQVVALGYRQTSSWTFAECEPKRRSDGGELRKFGPASRADVDAAWVFWSSSDLNRASRGLINHGWQWRDASPTDLESGATSGHLFQSPDGWLLADQPKPELLRVLWMATTPEDAPSFLDGVMDFATTREVEVVAIKAPNLPWMTEAITRVGGEPKEILIYSKAI